MAIRKLPPLTRYELAFWQRAFLGAEVSTLLKHGRRISSAGAAHLAAEYADAAVIELRRAKNGGPK